MSNALWRTMSAWYMKYMNSALRHFVLSAAQSPVLFVLFLGGILTYGAWFAWYMLANFDLINLIRDVNGDDSFYYFQIARNLAAGKFSTFDGGITQTNGYHPLWLLLITPFYWVFDPQAALFGIKALEIMLIAAGVAFIALSAQLARLSWILLFALLPTLYQIRSLWGGMEAAAALFMLGLFFTAICLFALRPARWTWPLAVIAFALPYARLEYVAISLTATAALYLIGRSWQEKPSGASLKAAESVSPSSRTFVPLLGACAGILVYFVYNRLVFGGFVPVSAASKQAWSQARWEWKGGRYSLAQNFQDVLQIHAFNDELLIALAICGYLLLVWWSARRSRSREDWLLLIFLVGAFSLAAGHIAKFAQTVLTVHPYWGSYSYYFVPAHLMKELFVPISCYVTVHFIRRFVGPKSRRAANILSLGIVIAGAIFFLFRPAGITPFSPFLYVDRVNESSHREWEITSYMGTQVMNHVLPEDSIVGAWDAGVIGYFSDFPVVNLDGLVNSYDYMRARQEGNEESYYRKYGITHFAIVRSTELNFDNALFEGVSFPRSEEKEYEFKLWSAEPLEASSGESDNAAWFWERIEPHFDYKLDEVGVLVDDRLAQVFVRDCEPEELLEKLFVVSWRTEGSETVASARYPWKNARENHLGFCVDAFALPDDAVHPVRIETMSARDYVERLSEDGQPIIRSNWNVYINGNNLIYVKDLCEQDDVEALFFLHLDPVEVNDLPGYRRQYGFDNLDFNFDRYGGERIGGICLAVVPLPGYDIIGIRTGQYIRVEGGYDNIWQAENRLVE